MRVKVDYRTASRDVYKLFCKTHKNISLSFDEWRNIIYTFNNAFREHILETGERVKLPAGLGEFSITKKKRRKVIEYKGQQYINLPIDWKKTKEKRKVIYNFNYHTNGYCFGWIWFRHMARIKFTKLWYFKAARDTSRLINHYLTVDENYQHKYCEWKK